MSAIVTNEYLRRARNLAEDPGAREPGPEAALKLSKAQVWATLALAEEVRLLRETEARESQASQRGLELGVSRLAALAPASRAPNGQDSGPRQVG